MSGKGEKNKLSSYSVEDHYLKRLTGYKQYTFFLAVNVFYLSCLISGSSNIFRYFISNK